MTVIIGAGLAGLAAARELRARGRDVVILEKSRGLGGRAATRRFDDIPVDYGAQFFTAREPAFAEEVRRWMEADLAFVWTQGFPTWSEHGMTSATEAHPRYACRSGMTALAKFLAEGVNILREHRVVRITPTNKAWIVACDNNTTHEAECLLITAPAPQASAIAGPFLSETQRAAIEAVTLTPCLTLVARTPAVPSSINGLHITSGPLTWIANDTSKRLAPSDHTYWVIHANATFSVEHLEDPPESWQTELATAAHDILSQQIPGFPPLEPLRTHRWRFAQTTKSLDTTFLLAPTTPRLLLAGDAFGHGRMESAWVSGRAAAAAI